MVEDGEVIPEAVHFSEMAERIFHNAREAANFGGAFVVVPPRDPQNPTKVTAIQTLILDSHCDPAQFWGLLKLRCDLAMNEVDEAKRKQNAWR